MEKQVRVGVWVLIYNENNDKVILGKRKGAHGSHTYHFTGGHLEFNEDILDCAKRETLEEVGFTNDIFERDRKHYITIFVRANIASGELRKMEPHKCEAWDWYSLDELPKELFIPIINARKKRLF